jgi:hypothetical protein
MVVEFELQALHLLGKCSIHLSCATFLLYFSDWVTHFCSEWPITSAFYLARIMGMYHHAWLLYFYYMCVAKYLLPVYGWFFFIIFRCPLNKSR